MSTHNICFCGGTSDEYPHVFVEALLMYTHIFVEALLMSTHVFVEALLMSTHMFLRRHF